ncbi:unnamed protein product [Mortierella alpina]
MLAVALRHGTMLQPKQSCQRGLLVDLFFRVLCPYKSLSSQKPPLHYSMLAAAYSPLGRASLAWPLRTSASLFKVRPAVARSCRHQLSPLLACHSTELNYSTTSHNRPTNQQSPHVPDNTRTVFFFDIDNCLYPKSSGIPNLMKARIEQYFRDSGIPHDEVERLANRYYIEYGLAIRGLVEKHPGKARRRALFVAFRVVSDVENSPEDYYRSLSVTQRLIFEIMVCAGLYDMMRGTATFFQLKTDHWDAIDNKVDGALPLENILQHNVPLREMIQAMKVGKKWLFTNAGEIHAKRVIKVLGLEGLFHGMTFCNYLEPKFVCKPDKKSFEKAMKEAGVSDPAQCFFVDDSASNIEMATKLGWTAVHVQEDRALLSTFGRFQIQSILDLPSVLPRFWEPVMKAESQNPEQPHDFKLADGRG